VTTTGLGLPVPPELPPDVGSGPLVGSPPVAGLTPDAIIPEINAPAIPGPPETKAKGTLAEPGAKAPAPPTRRVATVPPTNEPDADRPTDGPANEAAPETELAGKPEAAKTEEGPAARGLKGSNDRDWA